MTPSGARLCLLIGRKWVKLEVESALKSGLRSRPGRSRYMRVTIWLAAVCTALVLAAPAFPFAVTNPVTGECREVLVPGAAFPGNWEIVSNTPAEFPGPWNGVFHS